jgi:glycosyltransferase involved in cell wall biosynthesis
MYCQNQYYIQFPSMVGGGLEELGAHGIIGCSEAVRNFFKDVYGIPDVPILPCAVDPARFAPAKTKRRQIAFMPRKLPEDAAFIAATFTRRHPQFRNVPWVPIHGVSPREAARVMGESAAFLSLSHKESFGLPPLEAMACGCLVSGFHGDGGREYMNEANGWWADTGDWKACGDGLAAALQLLDQGGPELDARRRAMAETVERYSPAWLESALVAFWREELAKPFP